MLRKSYKLALSVSALAIFRPQGHSEEDMHELPVECKLSISALKGRMERKGTKN